MSLCKSTFKWDGVIYPYCWSAAVCLIPEMPHSQIVRVGGFVGTPPRPSLQHHIEKSFNLEDTAFPRLAQLKDFEARN
jgi:hypothetical protein